VLRLATLSLILAVVIAPLGLASLGGAWSSLARVAFFAFLVLFIIMGALTAWRDRSQL
jgi:uncharacterized membrane protein YtjA (UPF0391 family)